MGKVVSNMSMSLDGFIAAPDNGVPHIFDWYGNGSVEVPTKSPMVFHLTEASVPVFQRALEEAGAIMTGRVTFDYTNGWADGHPVGVPIVVVTHQQPEGYADDGDPFRFVTTGVEDALAVAQEIAGDKDIGVGGSVSQQLLALGLVDEIVVNLVPVLLGEGIRWFDHLGDQAILLENPEVIEGDRVTHLTYQVRKP
jgi:dihydrofolate reductase